MPSEDCQYTVSNRQRQNKCRDHSSSHALKQTGNCTAQIIYLWPVVDDQRRWIRCLCRTTHNYAKPDPHRIFQSVKDEIQTAIQKDCTHNKTVAERIYSSRKITRSIPSWENWKGTAAWNGRQIYMVLYPCQNSTFALDVQLYHVTLLFTM